jgi:predicted GNAT superfamily acetyltransferase
VGKDVRALADRAWETAHRAANSAGVELRPLDRVGDADAILRIMEATWGGHEPFPREMLRALADSGNVPYGALAGTEAIGYVLSWAGVEPADGLHVHSHMLATLPDRRHAGVGYALKLAQRAQALEQGIALVRWTFDPLVARNAYFNLHKLGGIADRFGRDFYGPMSDALNEGERSDRFTVRWDLEREPGPRRVQASEVVLAAAGEHPGEVASPVGRSVLVEVPREYSDLRERDRDLALRWRDASAGAIERCLRAEMVAVGFDLERSAYVFAAREDVPA